APPKRRTSRPYLACSRPGVRIADRAACTSIGLMQVPASPVRPCLRWPAEMLFPRGQGDPRGELLAGGEPLVRGGPDLGQPCLRHDVPEPGDGHEQVLLAPPWHGPGRDPLVQAADRGIEDG